MNCPVILLVIAVAIAVCAVPSEGKNDILILLIAITLFQIF